MSHDDRDVETVAEALRRADDETYDGAARAILDALDVLGRERRAKAKARKAALAEAIQAHRNLHIVYGSTSVCRGGIGGQAMTEHCGQTCDSPAHDEARAAWDAVELAYFDPEEKP